jgi:ABC-2 type transport system permease protein
MTVALRLFRDRRRSLGWWSLGMLGIVLVSVTFYPSLRDQPAFDDLFENLPEGVQALVGAGGFSIRSPVGYLHSRVFSTLAPIVLLIFAVSLGARAIGGSEDDGTLELLLANPVTRMRVAIERYVASLGLMVGLAAAMTVTLLALGAPFDVLEGLSITNLLAACVACLCLAVLHASIAFAVGAAFGGRAPAISAASAVAVGGYVVHGLVSSGVMRGARFFTPWYWYLNRNIVAEGPGLEAWLLPIGLSTVFAAIGVWRFRLRDLH